MKKVLFVTLAAVVLFAFVSTAFAAKTKQMSYSGQIVSVDPGSESMVVKGKDGKQRTFDVSDAKWKGYKDVNELQTGDQIKLTYENKDGKMEAKRVEKSSMKSAKSSAKQNADKSSASSRQQGTSSPTGGSSTGSVGSTSGMNSGSTGPTGGSSTGATNTGNTNTGSTNSKR